MITGKSKTQLAAMTEQIDKILHGDDGIDISVCKEGELYILQSVMQKMTVRLREQADTLKKDKAYLADSLADIAHQMRTPMTSIRMLASFLAKPDLETGQRAEFSREMESLLSRIDWLLATLLKISKIDAGTAVFEQIPLPLHVLLKKAAEPLEIPLELRDIELRMNCEESIAVICDLNWTAEAIGNILKNCMEYANNLIQIDCSQNNLYTEIKITDNGGGIDPEDLPYIFERFYQGKRQKDGNFGIGLALCRLILSEQGATVKAANFTEGGACFTVRFYKVTEL